MDLQRWGSWEHSVQKDEPVSKCKHLNIHQAWMFVAFWIWRVECRDQKIVYDLNEIVSAAEVQQQLGLTLIPVELFFRTPVSCEHIQSLIRVGHHFYFPKSIQFRCTNLRFELKNYFQINWTCGIVGIKGLFACFLHENQQKCWTKKMEDSWTAT